MGREVRRVPKGWEHPRYKLDGSDAPYPTWAGHYRPLHDETFLEAAKEWWDNAVLWQAHQHPDQLSSEYAEKDPYYWQYAGGPPAEDEYRPEFTSPADCYQIYETVSEGTPVSPVFESKEEMVAWLIEEGHSEKAAQAFVEAGYAPSMVVERRGDSVTIKQDIDIYDK